MRALTAADSNSGRDGGSCCGRGGDGGEGALCEAEATGTTALWVEATAQEAVDLVANTGPVAVVVWALGKVAATQAVVTAAAAVDWAAMARVRAQEAVARSQEARSSGSHNRSPHHLQSGESNGRLSVMRLRGWAARPFEHRRARTFYCGQDGVMHHRHRAELEIAVIPETCVRPGCRRSQRLAKLQAARHDENLVGANGWKWRRRRRR